MSECQWCGSFVTDHFARVTGKRDGTVVACPNCATNARLGPLNRERSIEDCPGDEWPVIDDSER